MEMTWPTSDTSPSSPKQPPSESPATPSASSATTKESAESHAKSSHVLPLSRFARVRFHLLETVSYTRVALVMGAAITLAWAITALLVWGTLEEAVHLVDLLRVAFTAILTALGARATLDPGDSGTSIQFASLTVLAVVFATVWSFSRLAERRRPSTLPDEQLARALASGLTGTFILLVMVLAGMGSAISTEVLPEIHISLPSLILWPTILFSLFAYLGRKHPRGLLARFVGCYLALLSVLALGFLALARWSDLYAITAKSYLWNGLNLLVGAGAWSLWPSQLLDVRTLNAGGNVLGLPSLSLAAFADPSNFAILVAFLVSGLAGLWLMTRGLLLGTRLRGRGFAQLLVLLVVCTWVAVFLANGFRFAEGFNPFTASFAILLWLVLGIALGRYIAPAVASRFPRASSKITRLTLDDATIAHWKSRKTEMQGRRRFLKRLFIILLIILLAIGIPRGLSNLLADSPERSVKAYVNALKTGDVRRVTQFTDAHGLDADQIKTILGDQRAREALRDTKGAKYEVLSASGNAQKGERAVRVEWKTHEGNGFRQTIAVKHGTSKRFGLFPEWVAKESLQKITVSPESPGGGISTTELRKQSEPALKVNGLTVTDGSVAVLPLLPLHLQADESDAVAALDEVKSADTSSIRYKRDLRDTAKEKVIQAATTAVRESCKSADARTLRAERCPFLPPDRASNIVVSMDESTLRNADPWVNNGNIWVHFDILTAKVNYTRDATALYDTPKVVNGEVRRATDIQVSVDWNNGNPKATLGSVNLPNW